MIKIGYKVGHSGFFIIINKKYYSINYPIPVWSYLPNNFKKIFSENTTFALTWQIPLIHNDAVYYDFAHPRVEPIFFELLTYSIPMSTFVNEGIANTSSLLKLWYNCNFLTTFRTSGYINDNFITDLKKNASLLFSFGKDSLLTYALLREMKIDCHLFFIVEPKSKNENVHKDRLKKRFINEFQQKVDFMKLSIGNLRQTDGNYWGWDAILAQYNLLIIPYLFYYRSRYIFFGNELSCSDYIKDAEGFYVNPVFEQSTKGLNLINMIPSLFGLTTATGSLIEGINEIFITYILFNRYPKIAKYQMSCISESKQSKKKRWCGECEKCARMYIFMKALNIDPHVTDFFEKDMLTLAKEKFFVIFERRDDSSAYGASGLGKDEQLLAFYLAYKNGTKGKLIDKFVNKYLNDVVSRLPLMLKNFFGIYNQKTVPKELKILLQTIFKKEQKKVFSYIKSLSD